MKRDLDLVRKLLIYFYEKPGPEHVQVPEIDGFDELTIRYHLVLLYQAGMLACEPTRSSTSERVISVLAFDLTWEGHEFLEKIRSETIWDEIRTDCQSRGLLTTSVEFIKKLADAKLKRLLNLE